MVKTKVGKITVTINELRNTLKEDVKCDIKNKTWQGSRVIKNVELQNVFKLKLSM